MFEGTDSVFNSYANPSNRRIFLCKISTMITETLIGYVLGFTVYGRFSLRKISMGSDRNKVEPVHGLSVYQWTIPAIEIYCLDQNLVYSWNRPFSTFFGPAVWIIQDGKTSDPIRCLVFSEWKPAFRVRFRYLIKPVFHLANLFVRTSKKLV